MVGRHQDIDPWCQSFRFLHVESGREYTWDHKARAAIAVTGTVRAEYGPRVVWQFLRDGRWRLLAFL